MDEALNETGVNVQNSSQGSLEDILETLEERQNQLLNQINKLNLMHLQTDARIDKLENMDPSEASENDSEEKPEAFEQLESEVDELKKDLELISEFLLNNNTHNTADTDEDSKVVKEDREVEEEIEILNNKVEGVMDRLNTVLDIEESHNSGSSSSNRTAQKEQKGLSTNAEKVLQKLKELDDVSVDKLVENTGMNREQIKEAYKELKEKGKL